MAMMYPHFGPKANDSSIAEPLVYKLLKDGLDDNFHVIHSIPWLSSVVDEFKKDSKSPIGEIDFLIFHAFYGVLAIEVKGGILKHDSRGFYYSQREQKSNPERQLRRGIFSIQGWFREKGSPVSLGHSYFFPQSEVVLSDLPPGVVDLAHEPPIKLVIDINDSDRIEKRITEIMDYFRKQLSVQPFKDEEILQLISMIVPEKDYSPCWYARIKNDSRTWLYLTPEQQECVQFAEQKDKLLVSGWPGSGKTIVAIQTARNFSRAKLNVLFITFNKLIASKIVDELVGFEGINVCTFHSLCRNAAESMGVEDKSQEWLNEGAYLTLEQAWHKGFFEKYDALIVDEGQAIREAGWNTLSSAFADKKIVVMFDMAQVFPYEKPTTQAQLESLITHKTFFLTQSLRIPKVVCNRIKLFSSPDYSVTNPRSEELDTLSEVISHNPEAALRSVIIQLQADNVPFDWITVLKPSTMSVSAELVPQGINVESIGRYRGMESPIIIIFATPNISDAELFCAYSRATSRCIVILDAYEVKQQKYASLGKQIYSDKKEVVETELVKSLTTTMLKNSTLTFEEVASGKVRLRWCKEWKAYTLDGEFSESVRLLMISHFSRIETPLIYTWAESSRNSLNILSQYSGGYFLNVSLSFCQNCGCLTPHLRSNYDFTDYFAKNHLSDAPMNKSGMDCIACRAFNKVRDNSFENHCKLINELLDNPKSFSEEQKKTIDPYIFSIGVLLKHRVKHNDGLIVKLLATGSDIGNVALILALFIMHRDIKKGILEFKVVDVAKESHLFNSHLADLSFSQWQAFMSGAFTRLEKCCVVEPVFKGQKKVNEEIFNNLFNAASPALEKAR